jgi:hypothetical protein
MKLTKNKKFTYLLICSVGIVWGIVLYKIFFSEVEEEYKLPIKAVQTKKEVFDEYLSKPDTFTLALNYRDPFLETVAAPIDTIQVKPSVEAFNKPVPVSVPIDWSIIKYSGRIINPQSKVVISIISVEGNERMVKVGEIFQGVKLLANKSDSILVQWRGSKKYIKQ